MHGSVFPAYDFERNNPLKIQRSYNYALTVTVFRVLDRECERASASAGLGGAGQSQRNRERPRRCPTSS